MIPIKIQCGCGQRYAFDIEPVAGQMPSAVACPVCGTDGTSAANAYLAQSAPTPPPARPAGGMPLRIASSGHSDPSAASAAPTPSDPRRPRGLLPGQIDRDQAVHEARAKISWGDAPEDVLRFLMIQGFGHAEAAPLVNEMFQERAATIRGNGIRKILIGIGLACVPVVSLLIFLSMGYLPLKLFAVTVMVGLWGLWMILKGLFMVVAPKAEAGDVAEQ